MWMSRGWRTQQGRGCGSVDGVEVEGGGKRDEVGDKMEGSLSGRYVEGPGASIGCRQETR